jgi:hypothetical protein
MDRSRFAAFRKRKYLNLETYRKTGAVVRTPVWFAQGDDEHDDADALYIYSRKGAGKVKRARNKPNVRIAPCNVRGDVAGDWEPAIAEVLSSHEGTRGHELLNRKYFLKRIAELFKSRETQDVIRLRPAPPNP